MRAELVSRLKSPLFLIVERNAVIGQDLAEIVRGHDPGCQVTILDGVAAAEAFLASHPVTLAAAFVAAPREGARGLDALAGQIASVGGRIVVMRELADPVDVPAGSIVLARPFTTNSVLRVLKDLGRDGDAADGSTR